MSNSSLAALAVLALVAGVAGAVLFAALSDDDDDGDDDGAEIDSPGEEADGLDNLVAPPEISSTANIPAEQRDRAVDRAASAGYELVGIGAVIDANGDLVLAAVGVDVDSLDGGGQRIFYFVDGDYRGTDWERPVISIASVTALDTGQFRVVYNDYAEGDRRCCPSAEPFSWIAAFDGSVEEGDQDQPPETIFTGA